MKKRLGPVEFYFERRDQNFDYYYTWDLGIQISLRCLAIMVGIWCAGVMWVGRARQ
jgi:hypothetical protein